MRRNAEVVEMMGRERKEEMVRAVRGRERERECVCVRGYPRRAMKAGRGCRSVRREVKGAIFMYGWFRCWYRSRRVDRGRQSSGGGLVVCRILRKEREGRVSLEGRAVRPRLRFERKKLGRAEETRDGGRGRDRRIRLVWCIFAQPIREKKKEKEEMVEIDR
jgi:hypothetical protein